MMKQIKKMTDSENLNKTCNSLERDLVVLKTIEHFSKRNWMHIEDFQEIILESERQVKKLKEKQNDNN